MNEQWWCVDCVTTIELDSHGRCSTCGSDAVDLIERRGFGTNPFPAVILPIRGSLTGHSSLCRSDRLGASSQALPTPALRLGSGQARRARPTLVRDGAADRIEEPRPKLLRYFRTRI